MPRLISSVYMPTAPPCSNDSSKSPHHPLKRRTLLARARRDPCFWIVPVAGDPRRQPIIRKNVSDPACLRHEALSFLGRFLNLLVGRHGVPHFKNATIAEVTDMVSSASALVANFPLCTA